MKTCIECGSKVGILSGYKHPVLGKSNVVCSSCFDKIDASVTKWRDFVQTNSFRNGTKIESKVDLSKLDPFKDVLKAPSVQLIKRALPK